MPLHGHRWLCDEAHRTTGVEESRQQAQGRPESLPLPVWCMTRTAFTPTSGSTPPPHRASTRSPLNRNERQTGTCDIYSMDDESVLTRSTRVLQNGLNSEAIEGKALTLRHRLQGDHPDVLKSDQVSEALGNLTWPRKRTQGLNPWTMPSSCSAAGTPWPIRVVACCPIRQRHGRPASNPLLRAITFTNTIKSSKMDTQAPLGQKVVDAARESDGRGS